MKARHIKLLKSLLVYWLVNLVLLGCVLAIAWLIAVPLLSFIFTREFHLPDITLIKAIGFVVFAAFWTGTILWLKEDVFENHD